MLEKRGLSKAAAEGITNFVGEVTETTLVTKTDLREAVQSLKVDIEAALHRQTWGLVSVVFAQGAFIVATLQLLN